MKQSMPIRLLKGEGEIWKEKENNFALDTGYASIEDRIVSLVSALREEIGLSPSLEELSELIGTLLTENMKQKEKIAALYVKQDKILEVLRNKLNLDF